MKPVRVSLSDRSYQIHFGHFEAGFPAALKALNFSHSKVLIVTSQAVKPLARRLQGALARQHFVSTMVVLPNGESQKNLGTIERLYRAGLAFGLDRKSLVIAVGGGVITDLAGFFAATYMRGIPYVSVPTSLLAMVDAAIGGKTGVDLSAGKNLVGAFWQPRLVWIDPVVLKTLSRRDWVTGFAEIIKYGVIKDRKFFEWLESRVRRRPDVRRWPTADVEKAIRRSVEIKARVVSGDEREKPLGGGREILNFGHTIGHALEAATGYRRLSHGEAISIGMIAAGHLARSISWWSDDAQLQLVLLLEAVGLPIDFPSLSVAQQKLFWRALVNDKKHVGGNLRFVLPKKIGRVELKSGISPDLVRKAIRSSSKTKYTQRHAHSR